MSDPPQLTSRTFAGWVPTITGHLSFSLIGLNTGLMNCLAANALCKHGEAAGAPKRYVAVTQKRVTTDFPYNGWPVGALFPSTKAEYLLVGNTEPGDTPVWRNGKLGTMHDAIGVLRGIVLVVPHHEDEWVRKRAKSLVQELRSLIASYSARAPRGSVVEISDLPTRMNEAVEKARQANVSVFSARFDLYRTGEFRLGLDAYSLPTLEEPGGGESIDGFATTLAHQMFYFVKDVSHRHYHHRRGTDNLLPLTEASETDDTSWRRESLWALVRSILEARRRNGLQSYKSALGILSYAEAFQAVLAKVRRGRNGEKPFVVWDDAALYDFRHTRSSLDASIGEREFAETSSLTVKSVIVAAALASAALWLAAVQVLQPVCDALRQPLAQCAMLPVWWAAVLHHLVANPTDGFGFFFVAALLWSGGRIAAHPLTHWLFEGLEGWAQALGASLSRGWRSILLGYSDAVAAIATTILMLLVGTVVVIATGAGFGLWLR